MMKFKKSALKRMTGILIPLLFLVVVFVFAGAGNFNPSGDSNLTVVPYTQPNNTFTNRTWSFLNFTVTNATSLDTFLLNLTSTATTGSGAFNSFNGLNSTVWDKGLVGAWHLEDNANDSSGFGNSGGLVGGVNCSGNVSGRLGSGCSFDGVDGYITAVGGKKVDLLSDWTISLWQKKNKTGYAGEYFSHGRSDSPNSYWVIRLDGNTTHDWLASTGRADDSTQQSWISEPFAILDSGWHHIAFASIGGTTITGYVDGVAKSQSSNDYGSGGKVWNNVNISAIGALLRINPEAFFNGSLDEVKIWSRALTAAEVSAEFNRTASNYLTSHSSVGNVHTFSLNMTNLTDGNYSWWAWANDSASNVATTQDTPRFLTVDTIPPVATIVPYSLANSSFINVTYALVNVSTTELSEHSSFVDFNNSLVGYWRFEDTGNGSMANDSSTYGSNGQMTGFGCLTLDCSASSGWVSNGKWGRAMVFDGVDDIVTVADASSLTSTAALTVEAWFKSDNVSSGWKTIIGKGTSDADEEYVLQVSGAQAVVDVGGGSGPYILRPMSAANNTWHHIAATHSRVGGTSTLKIYVDGIDLGGATNGDTLAIGDNSQPVSIGSRNSTGFQLFNGSIDEVKIWNRVLSVQEINASYQAGTYRLLRNFTGLTDGNYTWKASVVDSAGTLASTTLQSFSVDTKAPAIQFVANTPANNSYLPRNNIFINTSHNDVGSDHNDYSVFVDFNNSLVGYWRFEDDGDATADDFTNYNNDGTLYGFGCTAVDCNLTGAPGGGGTASGFVSSGKRGKAMAFDGVDDNVTVGDSASLTSTNALTIAVWAKPNVLSNWRDLVGKGNSDGNKEYGLALGATQVWFSVGTGSGPYIQQTAPLVKDKWHFIVATHSRSGGTSTLKVYVDGVDIGGTTGGATVAPNDNSLPLIIGSRSANSGYFNGSIDEVMIWNRVLSVQEVNASYQAGIYRLENNYTGLSDGNYSYQAFVVDAAGNINSSANQTFVTDTTFPLINFTANTHLNNTFINQNWTFINVSYTELYGNVFIIHNGTSDTTPNVIAGSFNYNFTNLPDGNYTYFATINDSANNKNVTKNLTVVVDATSPSVSFGLNSDSNGTAFNRNYLVVNLTVSELYGDNITITLMNGTYNASLVNHTANISGFGNYYKFSNLADGNYNFSASVRDAAGNVNTTIRQLRVDTTIPVLNVVSESLSNNTFRNSKVVLINVSAKDVNLYRFQINLSYEVNGTPISTNLSDNINVTELWKNYTFQVPSDGNYSIEFSATDDLTFSPPIPNYHATQKSSVFQHFTTYKDSVLGVEFNITAELLNPSPNNLSVSLVNKNFSSSVKKVDNHVKLEFSFDAPNPSQKLRLTLTPVEGNIVLRNDKTGHFVIGGLYYWHAKDVVDAGYNVTTGNLNGNYILEISGDWGVGRVNLDPVSGGLNVETKSSNVVIDTISPTVQIFTPRDAQEFNGNVTIEYSASDLYRSVCWYKVEHAGGVVVQNTTIDGCGNTSISHGEGAYKLFIYVNDSAGNVVYSTRVFQVVPSLPAGGGGGGVVSAGKMSCERGRQLFDIPDEGVKCVPCAGEVFYDSGVVYCVTPEGSVEVPLSSLSVPKVKPAGGWLLVGLGVVVAVAVAGDKVVKVRRKRKLMQVRY